MQLTKQQTKTMKHFALILLLLTVPTAYALAQPEGPGGDPGAPIDGGISLLVAAGIGYGAKKARQARKMPNEKNAAENGARKQ